MGIDQIKSYYSVVGLSVWIENRHIFINSNFICNAWRRRFQSAPKRSNRRMIQLKSSRYHRGTFLERALLIWSYSGALSSLF